MKKVFAGAIAALGIALIAGCSAISDAVAGFEYGSISVATGESARFLSGEEIQKADINVYANGNVIASKTGVVLNKGAGSATVDHIAVGKNRVVEVIGYKAENIEGQRLYCVTDIYSGENDSLQICDGEESAKGKAYLALSKAGVDVTNLSISGFVSGKSSYYFDSDAFVSSYKLSASTNPADYYTAAGVVTLSNIKNANGYTVWVGDPISSKLSISDNSTTTANISDVAPGTWNVYVNDGSAVKVAGTVTVTNRTGTFAELIGNNSNPLLDKVVIFVKPSSYTGIYAWIETTPATNLLGTWPGTSFSDSNKATSEYMNNPEGWYMLDVTSVYNKSGKEILFILNGNGQTGNISSEKTGTFWYDEASGTFYDADPTTPVVDTDVTLSDIKVNGVSIGASATSYSIGKNVTTAAVSATANSANAVVTVSPDGEQAVASGASKVFTISVTNNGNSASYTLTVKRAAANDTTLSSITVNGKSASISGNTAALSVTGKEDTYSITSVIAAAVDADAVITYSATSGSVADGGSKVFTITVKNGSETASYTLTVSYTKQNTPESEYYWTNKNGYGSNKTISSWSDWTEAEKIAQCAAYDDPRTWTGIQEIPYDVYALYAAYDDTNLYVMVELTNIVDRASFMYHNYAASDNAWWNNRDIPLGLAINTGAAVKANGPYLDSKSVIWGGANGGIEFTDSEGFDWLLYHSSKFGTFAETGAFVGVGTPGFFHVADNGYFSYAASNCLSVNSGTKTGTSGIDIKYMRQCAVSKKVYFESTPTGNRKESGQTGESLMASTTYTAVDTNDLDMSYWYTIPLSTLGMTKSDIETKGIGIRQLTTGGGSLMDCAPWDPCMVDVAGEYYSGADDYSSKEKEDVDTITTPQARIGHN